MENIIITIPKKMLSGRHGARQLVVVDPKEFEKELRRKWEEKDAIRASRIGRQEMKQGKARSISSLKDLMV